MTEFYVHALVAPTAVAKQPNGAVPMSMLSPVDGRTALVWLMADLPARGMRALHAACLKDIGVTLTSTGRGRTYDQQEALFRSRYTPTVLPGRPYKTWNGVRWYQQPNTAMAAVPGTSPHGLWCADDVAELDDGKVVALKARTVAWLKDHAPSFGFAWSV